MRSVGYRRVRVKGTVYDSGGVIESMNSSYTVYLLPYRREACVEMKSRHTSVVFLRVGAYAFLSGKIKDLCAEGDQKKSGVGRIRIEGRRQEVTNSEDIADTSQ